MAVNVNNMNMNMRMLRVTSVTCRNAVYYQFFFKLNENNYLNK